MSDIPKYKGYQNEELSHTYYTNMDPDVTEQSNNACHKASKSQQGYIKNRYFYYILSFLLLPTYGIAKSGDNYLAYLRKGCQTHGAALSCLKYQAVKTFGKVLFDENVQTDNATNSFAAFSLVPYDVSEKKDSANSYSDNDLFIAPRGFFSEWTELAKYGLSRFKTYLKTKGLRVQLPDGSQAVDLEEDRGVDEPRGKKKKLAIILPLLNLISSLKTKVLIIPILLGVLFIKKLFLVGALLLPSVAATLKVCKIPQLKDLHQAVHFSSPETPADFSAGNYAHAAGYSNTNSYKDWAANRAYSLPKSHDVFSKNIS